MRWLLNIAAVVCLMIGTYALMGPNSSSMIINVFQVIHGEAPEDVHAVFDYIQFVTGLLFICFALTWISLAYMMKKMLMIRKATHDNPRIYTTEEKRSFFRRASGKIESNSDKQS